MGKKIFVFLITAVVILTLAYSYFYISFNLKALDNSINQLYRKKVLANHTLRGIFKLHQVGDVRFDYAKDDRYTKLKIVSHFREGNSLQPETVQNFIQEINEVVDKPNGITIEEVIIDPPPKKSVNDEDLIILSDKYPVSWLMFDNTATLHIFVLNKYSELPTYTGLVKDGHSIFIFIDAINNLSNNKSTLQKLETSTLLHEFAHLLGAEHVDDEECILSEKVENTKGSFPPGAIGSKYCQADLAEITKALAY